MPAVEADSNSASTEKSYYRIMGCDVPGNGNTESKTGAPLGSSRPKLKLRASFSISPFFDELNEDTDKEPESKQCSESMLYSYNQSLTASCNVEDTAASSREASVINRAFDPGGQCHTISNDGCQQYTRSHCNSSTATISAAAVDKEIQSVTEVTSADYDIPSTVVSSNSSRDSGKRSRDSTKRGVLDLLHRSCPRSMHSKFRSLIRPFSFHGVSAGQEQLRASENKPRRMTRRSWSDQLLVANEDDYLLLTLQQDSFPADSSQRSKSVVQENSHTKTFDTDSSEGATAEHQQGNPEWESRQRGTSRTQKRVRFDPLAVLWDASLNGELEAVVEAAQQVTSISKPNDDGATALHLAVCAGNKHIVEFLLKVGADVNARDSDGWTPLHYAASMDNLSIARCLVEHGACIYAITISDHETPGDKCEETECACKGYLSNIQQVIGFTNGGCVFAAYDYNPTQDDELNFSEGHQLQILERDNPDQRGWWFATNTVTGKTGYVPRSYLALYPRVSNGTLRAVRPRTTPLFRINTNNIMEEIVGNVRWDYLEDETVIANRRDVLTNFHFNESLAIAV